MRKLGRLGSLDADFKPVLEDLWAPFTRTSVLRSCRSAASSASQAGPELRDVPATPIVDKTMSNLVRLWWRSCSLRLVNTRFVRWPASLRIPQALW